MTKKTGHASHDKVMLQKDIVNGKIDAAAMELLQEYVKLEKDVKVINDRKRDIRAKLKDDRGVLKTSFAWFLRLFKMDPAARAELVHSAKEFNQMLGNPLQMDFFIDESIALHQEDLKSKDPVVKAKAKVANIKQPTAH